MQSEPQVSVTCQNKGLEILAEIFIEKGWSLYKNEINHVIFKNPTSDYDDFEIRVDEKKIYVCVPLKNSVYKYVTHFSSYFQACEYVEMHFNDFLNLTEQQ
jgi:hypothetical protein